MIPAGGAALALLAVVVLGLGLCDGARNVWTWCRGEEAQSGWWPAVEIVIALAAFSVLL